VAETEDLQRARAGPQELTSAGAQDGDISAVLTCLSSNRTPIARRFGVWHTDPVVLNIGFGGTPALLNAASSDQQD